MHWALNLHTLRSVGDEESPRASQKAFNMQSFMREVSVLQVRYIIHSKLRSITPVATKVHVILRSFVVLTWMHDTIELV